jgi:hypothetical protein
VTDRGGGLREWGDRSKTGQVDDQEDWEHQEGGPAARGAAGPGCCLLKKPCKETGVGYRRSSAAEAASVLLASTRCVSGTWSSQLWPQGLCPQSF